jgi:hypothetical protein
MRGFHRQLIHRLVAEEHGRNVGQHHGALSRHKEPRIPSSHQSVFHVGDPSGGCIRDQHPVTKSDAERVKERHVTRKLLMTVAIVALALTPTIGIGTAQDR